MKEVQFADDVKEKGKRVPGKYESLSLSYGNRSDSNAHQIQIHRYTNTNTQRDFLANTNCLHSLDTLKWITINVKIMD